MLHGRIPIRIEWFHHLEGEKTKLNWFLYEVALEYYDRIQDNPELASFREHNDEKQIAQYCAYYARRLKESIFRYLRGQRKSVIFYHDYAGDFYPHHDAQMNALLSRVARESFDHMWPGCSTCQQQCLRDHEAKSPLFDKYKEQEE